MCGTMGFLSPELSGAVPGHNLGGWGMVEWMDPLVGWMLLLDPLWMDQWLAVMNGLVISPTYLFVTGKFTWGEITNPLIRSPLILTSSGSF